MQPRRLAVQAGTKRIYAQQRFGVATQPMAQNEIYSLRTHGDHKQFVAKPLTQLGADRRINPKIGYVLFGNYFFCFLKKKYKKMYVTEFNTQYGKAKRGVNENGETIIIRPGSSDGAPTIERQVKGQKKTEIRYED